MYVTLRRLLTSLSCRSFFSALVTLVVPSLNDDPLCRPLCLMSFGLFLLELDVESADEFFWSCGLFFGEVTCLRLLDGDSGGSSFKSRERDMEGVRRIIFLFSSSLNELAFFKTPENRKKDNYNTFVCIQASLTNK